MALLHKLPLEHGQTFEVASVPAGSISLSDGVPKDLVWTRLSKVKATEVVRAAHLASNPDTTLLTYVFFPHENGEPGCHRKFDLVDELNGTYHLQHCKRMSLPDKIARQTATIVLTMRVHGNTIKLSAMSGNVVFERTFDAGTTLRLIDLRKIVRRHMSQTGRLTGTSDLKFVMHDSETAISGSKVILRACAPSRNSARVRALPIGQRVITQFCTAK